LQKFSQTLYNCVISSTLSLAWDDEETIFARNTADKKEKHETKKIFLFFQKKSLNTINASTDKNN
jgi:hypothetical protein